jgi:hypothetical protein
MFLRSKTIQKFLLSPNKISSSLTNNKRAITQGSLLSAAVASAYTYHSGEKMTHNKATLFYDQHQQEKKKNALSSNNAEDYPDDFWIWRTFLFPG